MMEKSGWGAGLGAIIGVGVFGMFIVGWIMNIAAIVKIIDLPVTGMFILRCVGIFVAPLGSILGLFF
jgi:predicted lipid-binding transport protein (Tim44 family)